MQLPEGLKVLIGSLRLPGIRRTLITDVACCAFGVGPRAMMLAQAKRLRQCVVVKSKLLEEICQDGKTLSVGELQTALTSSLRSAIVYPSCIELEVLPAEISLNNEKHRIVLTKWTINANTLHIKLGKLLARMQPQAVVFFQGYLPESAILRMLSIERQIPILSIERCAFDKRLTWDNESGLPVHSNIAKRIYAARRGAVDQGTARAFVDRYLTTIDTDKQDEHSSPSRCFSFGKVKSEKLRLLFIGQVYTDSSIIYGLSQDLSPLVILDIISAFAMEGGHQLVVKLHPKEYGGSSPLGNSYNRLTYRKITAKTNWIRPDWVKCHSTCIDHENRWNTFHMIRQADLVVTINSQAGLEAALMGKPVFICGNAFYSGLGFTKDVFSQFELRQALSKFAPSEATSRKIADKAAAFFYSFYRDYTVKSEPETLFHLLRLLASPAL